MKDIKCKICNKKKPITDFYKHKFNKNGISGSCKLCDKEKVINRYRTKTGLITHIYSNQKIVSKQRNYSLPKYSKKELVDWLFLQEKFHLLFDNWVDSGYDRNLTPSIDRLDDYKPYSFDNIRIVVWEENRLKAINDIKSGINNKLSRPIIQLDLKNRIIKKYHSVLQAERETKISNTNIISVCSGKTNTAGGFIWKYAS